MSDAADRESVWNRELLLIMGATFLVYSNISVFFHFYEYLRTLSVDPRAYGLLISVFSAVPLLVRPLISPFFHTGNAYRFLYLGTVLLIGSLTLYSLAHGFWSMLGVRVLHGLSFVLLGTALMTVTIEYIPKGRSAQFFGLLAVIVLIPNTIVPPALPFLARGLGGFTQVLILFAVLTGLVFPLLAKTRKAESTLSGGSASQGLSKTEILEDLGDTLIACLLLSMLLLYTAHALVFFFLDGFSRHIGIMGAGFFLTLSTVGEIGVRIAAGSLFDRFNKGKLAALCMMAMVPAYWALACVRSENGFFLIGFVLGLGWGIAMPVFNALLFDVSRPRLRAFNTNMGFQMFQGGFFLGPFIGALLIACAGFRSVFIVCAVFSLASAALTLSVAGKITKTLAQRSETV